MSRILYILFVATILGCTSPYRGLTRGEALAIERSFDEFATKHGLTNFCDLSPERMRTIVDIEGPSRLAQPPRFEYLYVCRFLWLGEDSLYRGILLVNRRDMFSSLEHWRMHAFLTSQQRDETRAIDTIFAQSNDIPTFQDNIPSYLEQAHGWTLSKIAGDLKLVWKRE
jgi:hypothetical protein